MTGLASKKCIPCQAGMPPMKREEAEKKIMETGGWLLSEDAKKISKEYKFRDFKEAMKFINKAAELAEQEGQHPDMCVSYNKVRIDIWTHKIKGLHENDFILAAKINKFT